MLNRSWRPHTSPARSRSSACSHGYRPRDSAYEFTYQLARLTERVALYRRLRLSESFSEKMRRARQVAGEVRSAVQSTKAAMMQDADEIIAAGEAVHAKRTEIDRQRTEVKAAHHASIRMDHADLQDQARELAEMQAELAQWGNGAPLDDGGHSEEGSPPAGLEPGKLAANAWTDAAVGNDGKPNASKA